MNKKVVIVPVLLSMFLIGSFGASALTQEAAVGSTQITPVNISLTTPGDVDPGQVSTCLNLKSNNLRYRTTDAMTNGEVSSLQDFLVASSFLKSQVTGFFGLATFSAVKQFQKNVGLNPTGYVGLLTKAKIKEQSCDGIQAAVTSDSGKSGMVTPGNGRASSYVDGQEINPQNTFSPKQKPVAGEPIRTVMCTMEARFCPDGGIMRRNPATCEWMLSSCVTASGTKPLYPPMRPYSTTSPISDEIAPPLPPVDGQEINSQNVYNPKIKIASTTPLIGCNMVRLCPNGAAMFRGPGCGEWHPEMCTVNNQGGLQLPQVN